MLERFTVVTRKGQVTIPVEVRRALDLVEGDTVAWILEENGVRLQRRKSVVAQTAGTLRGEEPPLAAEEERAAAEQLLAEEVSQRGSG